MKVYSVALTSAARDDLLGTASYIAERGGVRAAERFSARITAYVLGLRTFPHRGREGPRGRRTVGLGRRVTIVFRVREDVVEVLRIAYRGRDVSRLEDTL